MRIISSLRLLLPSRSLRRLVLVLLLGSILLLAQNLPNTTRLLRFPATNDRQIVFCYAGELYTVPKDGGTARRLTSGPGYSSFPRFSADGTQLAFTSQYDGNTEVYVMPGEGGVPKRLTTTATFGRDDISDRMGPNNIVMTWENTKPLVVFRSRMKTFNSFIGSLYTVGLDAELPQQLPVPRGGFASFSPDDSKMAFNRVFREFRTWKHYRGGMADDVWIFDFKTGTTQNLTNNEAQDICPMWGPDNRIYFALGSRRPDESFLDRSDRQGDEAAHHLQGFRHQVSLDRQGIDRLRTGGLHLALRSGQRKGDAGADRDQGGFRLRPFRVSSTRRKTFNRSAPRRMRSASSWSRAAIFSRCR